MKSTLGTTATIAVSLWLSGAPQARASYQPGTVVSWGDNTYGQTNIPVGLAKVVAISGGAWHNMALKSDGTIIAWGANICAGTTNVPKGLGDVVAVSGGGAGGVECGHNLALKSDGTVIGWGLNGDGQADVPFGMSNIVAISAGGYHSLALRADGSVAAWGYNGYGLTNVPAGSMNIVGIAAGGYHNLALRGDSTVVAWGDNGYGQTNVPAGLIDVATIAAGERHSLALKSNGTVVAWGYNYCGQTNVPTGLTNVVAISAGSCHSLALVGNGTVVVWGSSSRTNVPSGLTNVVAIAGGLAHSSVLINPGTVIWPSLPAPVSISQGGQISLNLSLWDKSAFTAHWYFDGSPIAGTTPASLVVSNFDLTKAGSYSVTVTNTLGADEARTVLRLVNSPVVLVNGIDVGGGSVDHVDSTHIAMSSTFGGNTHIYYTLDGSAPDFTGIPYTGPFTLMNSATIRAIAYNFAFTDSAEAAPITVQVWPTYPLSATTPGGGSIGLSPAPYSAGNRYVSNTVVTLTATPASNWSFLGWTSDSSATSNVTSVLMDRTRAVTGVFGMVLNLFTNGSGQVQLNPPTGPYAFGSNVKLTALPAPGYYFFGWANAASGFGNPLTFAVTNAAGITANFGALAGNQVSLVVLPNGNGTVSVNPAKNVYTNGELVTLTAWPAANQTFTGWSGDAAGNLNPLALALTTSKLITASFAPGASTNPPVITQPPLSRTLSAGADTLLSFGLTGDGPFSYQWRLNSSAIPGATNPTLHLVGVTPADAGRYEIAVIGPGGAVTSAPASVAIFGMQLIPSGGSPVPLLILDGALGSQYRLETSPNLALSNWALLTPLTLPSTRFYYADTESSNQPARFYRAVPQ